MKRFLPVIHIKSLEHTLEQVQVATDNGADGVWLINHDGDSTLTFRVFEGIRKKSPELWVGLNLLDFPAHAAMNIVLKSSSEGGRIDGLWADHSGVTDEGASYYTRQIWDLKAASEWPGEYFGSVAFKAGPIIQDAARAADAAKGFMDVVVTSGSATGVPASVEKVRQMKGVLGVSRLGVASGVTPENVIDYLPYVDDFLVATGISSDFHTLQPTKTRQLADQIHEKR